MKGNLIVIEGIDGAGKHTQAVNLSNYLKALEIPNSIIDFPQYTSKSSGPVQMYLNGELGEITDMDAYQASMLYLVDQLCTIKAAKIEERLAAGETIICDRYVVSNLIHQSVKLYEEDYNKLVKNPSLSGLDFQKILEFSKWLDQMAYTTLKLPRPDIVFMLTMSKESSEGLLQKREEDRQNEAKSKGETYSPDIHEKDRKYLRVCSLFAELFSFLLGWSVIDCDNENTKKLLTPIDIRTKIVDVLRERKMFYEYLFQSNRLD